MKLLCTEFMHTYILERFQKSRVIRSKKFRKFKSSEENQNHVKKLMDWLNDDENLNELSCIRRNNALEKSKSDSSVTAIGDCNYRTQGIQVSLENCDLVRNVTSNLLELHLHGGDDDDDDDDENLPSFISHAAKEHPEYQTAQCGYRTQDITTRQIVIQTPKILHFQGIWHSSDEIAPYWKKDCRKWLWKSIRLENWRNRLQNRVQDE